MIKHRLNDVKRRGLMYLMGLSLLGVLIVSCDDDFNEWEQPGVDKLYVTGPRASWTDSTATYSVATGSVSWSITGPATLSATSGEEVTVTFNGTGDVQLTVSGTGLQGRADISVSSVSASFEISYGVSGVIGDGGSDNVIFTFPAPLKAAPTLYFLSTADTSVMNYPEWAFRSGGAGESTSLTLTSVGGDMSKFQATYNAGTGPAQGQIEARLDGVELIDAYGAGELDSVFVALHTIDIVAPIGLGGSLDTNGPVKDSTEVTVTVEFNEAVRSATADADGGYGSVFIDLSYSDGSGLAVTDTLKATDDPAIWSLMTTTNGEGDGTLDISVDLSQFVDLAGNALSAGGGTYNDAVVIDNTAATAGGTASSTDNSRIDVVVDNPGDNGGEVWIALQYVGIYNDDDELTGVEAPDAPILASQFDDGVKGSGSLVVETMVGSDEITMFDVYFIHTDEAGNVSAISGASTVDVVP